jgi:CheY-like chemotaxis protein
VLLPNFTYALALQFLPGACDEGPWAMPSSPFPNQVRVLCVESDSGAARALREILEKDGYHVVIVSNAQEALDTVHGETPDVILAQAEGQEISGKDFGAVVCMNIPCRPERIRSAIDLVAAHPRSARCTARA